MKLIGSVIGSAVLGLLATQPVVAGQTQAKDLSSGHETAASGGQKFDDDVIWISVWGQTPTLDPHVANSVRYAHLLTDSWSLEFSIPQSATNVAGTPDVDPDLATTFVTQTTDLR